MCKRADLGVLVREVCRCAIFVICLTRGAGRYKYLNLMLVAYKNITDRQI